MTITGKDCRRILYVIGSLELGGAEQHIVQIARQLKMRSWLPEVFVFEYGGPLATSLEEAEIHVHCVPSPKWLSLLPGRRTRARVGLLFKMLRLMYLMYSRKPLIVHFFLPAAYLIGGLAALLTQTRPCLMSRRSLNNYQTDYPIATRLECWLHPRMDRICGNSKAVVSQLIDEGVTQKQLSLIYNGIDLGRFEGGASPEATRRRLGIAPNSLVLVVVANLIVYKGHRDLLLALSRIQEELPKSWVCLCVGRNDGIGDQLRLQAAELGVERHLRWLGSRPDVPELLLASDIGILCSHQEGFSNAVIECMAAGLPMIVTDVGGNPEAVVDGVTGVVVPPKSPEKLASAMLALSNDASLRREMGLRGRKRVEECFSLEKCVDSYHALYSGLGNE